jgi:hypothetical protein
MSASAVSVGWLPRLGGWLSTELGAQPRRYCVVHNAAAMPKDSALALEPQTLRDSLELNTVVPAEINRLLYPQMLPGSSILCASALRVRQAPPPLVSVCLTPHRRRVAVRAGSWGRRCPRRPSPTPPRT